MQIIKKLNGFCAVGKHNECKGVSKGTKSDPVTFVCICECHYKGKDNATKE